MEWLMDLVELVLHFDAHLDALVARYGAWVYALVFLIVFCETGLVVTPILPGDSLLFAVGALCARAAGFDIWIFMPLLVAAAILGDSVNYWVGHYLGDTLPRRWPRLVKQSYIDRTHAFYERYGAKTIVIARFVPIIRTFAPFVAGIGRMTYGRFMLWNVLGGVLWVCLIVPAGYFFGNLPVVRENFSLVVLAIIFLSLIPAIVEYLRRPRGSREQTEIDLP